jgi:hypothetical protein
MGRKLYAVVRHNGQWGISVYDASFLSCSSFQEALEVATSAAAILRSTHAAEQAAGAADAASLTGNRCVAFLTLPTLR